jgi:hypothetical protein
MVIFTIRSLYPPGQSSRYTSSWKLSGPYSRCRRFGAGRNLLFLPKFQPRWTGRSARRLLAIIINYLVQNMVTCNVLILILFSFTQHVSSVFIYLQLTEECWQYFRSASND